MNNLILKRKLITYMGLASIALSAVVAGTGLIYHSLNLTKTGTKATSESACLEEFRAIRQYPSVKNGAIELYYKPEDIELAVYQVAVAVERCPGFTLRSFCAGTGCDRSGLTLSLQPVPEK